MQKGATTVHNTGNSCHPRFSKVNISRRQKGQLTSGLALKVGYVSCCLNTLTASQLSKTIRNSVFDRFLVKNLTATSFNEIARRRMLNWGMGYTRACGCGFTFCLSPLPIPAAPPAACIRETAFFLPGASGRAVSQKEGRQGQAGAGGPPSLREPE